MILYFLFLSVLFVVYFLFAYEFTLRVDVSFHHVKVKAFFIPVLYLKGEKYRNFLKKLIPKDQNQMNEEIDVSSLIMLVHIDFLSVEIRKNVNDYVNYLLLVQTLEIAHHVFAPVLEAYVEKYRFKILADAQNNLRIRTKFHFNIGIILINLLLIKRRYRHVSKTDQ